jgi:Mn-dependent DtxR family transcriptional regulator
MLKMKLGAGLEVALYLMSQSDYGGMCMAKNGDVAKELGISPTYVSTLIWKLHRAGVLHKVGPRTVFMNPAFLFRGSAQEQHRALERWSVYRRELMVKENTEAA